MAFRRTHNYPRGKPLPLVLLDVGMAGVVGLWVFLVPGHWTRAIGVIGAFLLVAFIGGHLTRRYERTGKAVPIPRTRVIVKFSKGLPQPMVAMRLAFFLTVAFMLVFGFAPFTDSTAKVGIIACVFALIGIAISNFALERHYVNTGRALEMNAESGQALNGS
jgi:hypothetical protein